MNSSNEKSICPQCAGNAVRIFVASDLNLHSTRENFSYFRCESCDVIFLHPLPPQLDKFYPTDYHAIPRTVADLKGSLDNELHKVQLVQKFTSGLRLLEIGPSFGAFCLLAKETGFNVSAVELDPECCKFLREAVGIEVYQEPDVPKFLESGEKYDAICLWHSLEHLPDPWAVLDRIRGALRDGGSLFVATPNPDSFQFRLFGRYWLHLDAPRHVELIPIDVLKARQDRNGFELRHVTTDNRTARLCNEAGWRVSLNHVFGTAKLNRWTHQIGLALGSLLSPWERREGRGSAYTAVFRLKSRP